MTPLELFGLICVFGIVRVAIGLRPGTAAGAGPAAESPGPTAVEVLREYLDAFIVAGLVALFLITFVTRTFFIPSESMLPTLQVHDVLLVNEFEYRLHPPHDGDIDVFLPAVPTPNDFIKRVIGSPGEKLRIRDGVVVRNDRPLAEPYIEAKPAYDLAIRNYGIYVDGVPLDPATANIPPRSRWTAPDRIPPGCYFMMGDNRNDSEDSHVWGFAQPSGTFATGRSAGQAAHFTGHAFVVFWPLNRIHLLN